MDKRRYPRLEVHAQQRILNYSPQNEIIQNVVFTRNLSASGFCFRSSRSYTAGERLLVYFDASVCEDIRINRGSVMKIGKYFLARVIWSRLVPQVADPYHETGCRFVEMADGNENTLEFFTRLVNHDVAHTMEKINPAEPRQDRSSGQSPLQTRPGF